MFELVFGPDNSGDILKWTDEYINSIAKEVGRFSLITADGSLYCQDNPAEQERIIFPLLQKEIDISLSLLQTNGTFIIKMYTTFLNDTVTLLNRLLICFEEIHVIKPSCSKPGNSEILLECSKFFVQHQMQMIWFNIATFGKVENDLNDFIEQKKIQAAEIYEQMMTISNFEKFTAELSSASFTLHKRPNPWKFSKLGGFIEGLRNITAQKAQILIENMIICDLMKGNNVAAEQKFDISPCWTCDCCQWIDDFALNKRNLEEMLKMGDAPSEMNIKHTLFLEPKILALLKSASLGIQDICFLIHHMRALKEGEYLRSASQHLKSIHLYSDLSSTGYQCLKKCFFTHRITSGRMSTTLPSFFDIYQSSKKNRWVLFEMDRMFIGLCLYISSNVNTFTHRYYITIRSWHEEYSQNTNYGMYLCDKKEI
ncbi:Ribosomal RNA large subunit methyltransferase J [Dirofilaria immitis]|nr:Ribosomal RNA large subunit methyltransferase J [Dirofilaria immitis]